MQATMRYTVGTALGRARDHGVRVRVLFTGQWIDGLVGDLEGQVSTARTLVAAETS